MVITDASAAVTKEAHQFATPRAIAVGVTMMTWMALAAEWQRDWARAETAMALNQVIIQPSAGIGTAFLWEQQWLSSAVKKAAA